MRPPCSDTCAFRKYPVTFGNGLDARTCAEDFKNAFVPGNGGWLGRSESAGERRLGGIGTFDLVYVCRIKGAVYCTEC